MYEAKDKLSELKETDKAKAVEEFLKKFTKLTGEKAKALKKEIEWLGIIKLRPFDVIKIVDFLPENAIELNKIFAEISLDTDETNKILDTIKKHG